MNHEQFDHVIRAAGAILGEDEIVVIGSQAILASIAEPPETALRSIEVDVLPVDGSTDKSDLIDGSIGEASMFQDAFGIYAQGVGPDTAVLPDGWKHRLVPYATPATNGVTALCLDPVDLVVAKVAAGREKDAAFVVELVALDLVSLDGIIERIGQLGDPGPGGVSLVERLQGWVGR